VRTFRRALPIVAWVAGLVVVVLGLGAAGHGALAAPALGDPGSWGDWLAAREAPDAAMAVLRLVALGLAWYLLGATVLAVVVRVGRAGRLVSVADVVTVPFVRSLVQAGVGVGVVVASVGPMGVERPPVLASSAAVSQVWLSPLPDASADPPPVLQKLPATVAPAPERTWVVAPGDHFWSISATVLGETLGRAPSDRELVGYWQHLVDANRPRLADPANPDLLFPGQSLVVPAAPPP
jgi:hypothetical protein